MFIDKIKLVILSVISGILVGLGAIILHSLFNIIWTDILQVASPSWRSQLVIVSGLVSSIGWYFLQRKGKELVSVEKQIFPKTSREQFPDFGRQMGHILLQIVTVGLGSPIGKEVAPRELGSLFSTYLAKKVSITAEERSVLVAGSTVANLEDYLAGQVLSEQVPSYPKVTALEVRDVAYRVGELAVADFSYRFDKGKKYAIIGPSASGKSTFLRVLAGELALDMGSVSYLEHDVSHEMEAATAFYLSQFEHLYHTDFENNVSVFGTYEKGRDVMLGLLRSLPTSLQDTLRTTSDPSLLSGGEKNTLCLLRALMSGKDILLLDEPTAHLDPALTKQVLTHLLQLEDKLIITILHQSDPAILDMFDVVLEMRDGKLNEKI